MQGRLLTLAVMTMLLARSPRLKADRKPISQCGVSPKQGWREFVDQAPAFCFWYPPTYRPVPNDSTAEPQQNRQALATFVSEVPRRATADDKEGALIEVWRSAGAFDLAGLAKDAPTGGINPPSPIHLGANTFYYYGAGGGGVAYPDRFYFNLHGHTLEMVFDGPYNRESKSPNAQTQAIEKVVLLSFKPEPK